jgi:hypothetical protein
MDENKTNKRVIFRPHAIPNAIESKKDTDISKELPSPVQSKTNSKNKKEKQVQEQFFISHLPKNPKKEKEKFIPKPVGMEYSSNSHHMQLNPTYDDQIILQFSQGTLLKEDIFYIRNIVKNININDVKTSIDFGVNIQENIRELTQSILSLNKYDNNKLNGLFKDLFKLISSISENDLNSIKGNFREKLHAIMSGISAKEHIFIVINKVDDINNKIENELPCLLHFVDDITAIETQYLHINKKLRNYIIAGRVILFLLDENKNNITNKSNKDSFSSKVTEIRNIDSSVDAITKRINSLLLTFENEEVGDMQINLLKENYMDLIEFSRETILGLSTRWKSQCISTISMAEAGLYNSLNTHIETFSLIKSTLCRELTAKLNN